MESKKLIILASMMQSTALADKKSLRWHSTIRWLTLSRLWTTISMRRTSGSSATITWLGCSRLMRAKNSIGQSLSFKRRSIWTKMKSLNSKTSANFCAKELVGDWSLLVAYSHSVSSWMDLPSRCSTRHSTSATTPNPSILQSLMSSTSWLAMLLCLLIRISQTSLKRLV